jgi:hypothetical protein
MCAVGQCSTLLPEIPNLTPAVSVGNSTGWLQWRRQDQGHLQQSVHGFCHLKRLLRLGSLPATVHLSQLITDRTLWHGDPMTHLPPTLQAGTPRSTGTISFRTRDPSAPGATPAAGAPGSSNQNATGSPRSTGNSPKASSSGAGATSGGGAFDGLFKSRAVGGAGAASQSRHRLSRLGTLTQPGTSQSGSGPEGQRGPDPQGLPQLQEGQEEGGDSTGQQVGQEGRGVQGMGPPC